MADGIYLKIEKPLLSDSNVLALAWPESHDRNSEARSKLKPWLLPGGLNDIWLWTDKIPGQALNYITLGLVLALA
jgi:hypothetical protein